MSRSSLSRPRHEGTAGIVVIRHGGSRFFRDGVFIDGEEVARIRRGRSATIRVAPGEHTLQIRDTRLTRSPEVRVQLAAGDEARFSYSPDLEGRAEHRRLIKSDLERRVKSQRLSERWFVVAREP